MKIDVYNTEGKKTAQKLDLNPKIFGVADNQDLVYQVINSLLANQRKVTASTKTRAEVRGGGRKPWRQKGTGRARAGSIRSPIWRGGGVIFGPRVDRNYKKSVPRKIKQKAMMVILSAKVSRLIVVDKLKIEKPSTKKMAEILSKLPVEGKILILYPGKDENLRKSVSNLVGVKSLSLNNLNALDLMNCDFIVISKDGLSELEKRYVQ